MYGENMENMWHRKNVKNISGNCGRLDYELVDEMVAKTPIFYRSKLNQDTWGFSTRDMLGFKMRRAPTSTSVHKFCLRFEFTGGRRTP